jgi:hypothetical protein
MSHGLKKICSRLLDQRKQAKLQWLQNPREINGNNLNNVRRKARRHFTNKKREYLKNEISWPAMNSKNNRDLYRRINSFKKGYQPINNLVKDENGYLLIDFLNILNNYVFQLLKVHNVSDVKQIELRKA